MQFQIKPLLMFGYFFEVLVLYALNPSYKTSSKQPLKHWRLIASNNIWKKQTVRDVDGPYLPLQDKSAYFILSPYYGRNQLIPLARNQDPFFSRNPNNMPLNFLPYAKEVFGILVIVHQFHSDKGYWVGSRYQKSLPKCLLICHVETFEVINQEQSPIKGGLFIVSCTNFMSRYGSFGRINCHFNQSDL